jgi:hypothetical protein
MNSGGHVHGHRQGASRRSRRTLVLGAAVGVAAAILVTGDTGSWPLPDPPEEKPPSVAQSVFDSRARAPVIAWPGIRAVVPVRLRVPAIGVDTSLEQLDIDRNGELKAPRRAERAGWFRGGPAPGDIGPAVVAGHVDSRTGPAVFYRLSRLRAGDVVLVDRSDGRLARFRVTSVTRHRKDEFPTRLVYSTTPGRELRLITCGGPYDHRRGTGYRDNVVVTATLFT